MLPLLLLLPRSHPTPQANNLEDMRCMGIATPTVEDWAAGLR